MEDQIIDYPASNLCINLQGTLSPNTVWESSGRSGIVENTAFTAVTPQESHVLNLFLKVQHYWFEQNSEIVLRCSESIFAYAISRGQLERCLNWGRRAARRLGSGSLDVVNFGLTFRVLFIGLDLLVESDLLSRGWNPTAPMSSKRPKWFGPTFTANYKPEVGTFSVWWVNLWLTSPKMMWIVWIQEWNNMRLREIKHCRLVGSLKKTTGVSLGLEWMGLLWIAVWSHGELEIQFFQRKKQRELEWRRWSASSSWCSPMHPQVALGLGGSWTKYNSQVRFQIPTWVMVYRSWLCFMQMYLNVYSQRQIIYIYGHWNNAPWMDFMASDTFRLFKPLTSWIQEPKMDPTGCFSHTMALRWDTDIQIDCTMTCTKSCFSIRCWSFADP